MANCPFCGVGELEAEDPTFLGPKWHGVFFVVPRPITLCYCHSAVPLYLTRQKVCRTATRWMQSVHEYRLGQLGRHRMYSPTYKAAHTGKTLLWTPSFTHVQGCKSILPSQAAPLHPSPGPSPPLPSEAQIHSTKN